MKKARQRENGRFGKDSGGGIWWYRVLAFALLLLAAESPVRAFITGFDTTLNPPAPNNSLLLNVPAGYEGGISALVFPYNGDTPAAGSDNFGESGDGLGANIDRCAGAKFAARWDPNGGGGNNRTYQFGLETCDITGDNNNDATGNCNDSTCGANRIFTENSRTETTFNITPFGDIEAVTEVNLTGGATANRTIGITQKTIIRNNNTWFGQTYRITNTGNVAYNENGGVLFSNGVDWNYRGSYGSESSYYDGTTDTLVGSDDDASGGLYVSGGFSARCTSGGCSPSWTSVQQRCVVFNTNWSNMRDNYAGATGCPLAAADAAGFLRWTIGTLNTGAANEIIFPLIWSFQEGNTAANARTAVINSIQGAMPSRYDAGALNIAFSPITTNYRYNSLFNANIAMSGNVGLRGFVDLKDLPNRFQFTGPSAPAATSAGTVNLTVPSQESQAVPTPYTFTMAGKATGSYTASLCTRLQDYTEAAPTPNLVDAVTTNDCVTQAFSIVDFLIESDGTLTQAPGTTASYSGSTYKTPAGAVRYDFSTSASTQAWETQLWYSGPSTAGCLTAPGTPCMIAADTNGDGTWDSIPISQFNNDSDAFPDISVPGAAATLNLFQIRKVIPATEALGVTDVTVITATAFGGATNSDELTVTTSTTAPPLQTKTQHLHPSGIMNTFPDTQAVSSSTTLPSSANVFWNQNPAFATPFTISGNITGTLYIGTAGVSRSITVTLFSVGPAGCTANLGSQTQNVNQPTANPALSAWSFAPVPANPTIPAGCRIVAQIRNNTAGASTVTIYHDNQGTGHRSRFDMQTSTYITISSLGLYTGTCPGTTKVTSIAPTGVPDTAPTGSYNAGDGVTACVRATVADPFGAGDIGNPPGGANSATVSVTDPTGGYICYNGIGNPSTSCNSINALAMTENVGMATASSKTYQYGIPIGSKHKTGGNPQAPTGTYTVAISSTESNGVVTARSFTFFVTAALAAKLLSFEATGYDGRVDVRWLTGQEINTLGYNIYRSDVADRGFVSVNPFVIKGLGYSTIGGSYVFSDTTAENGKGYFYILEEVEESGKTHRYGPIFVRPQAEYPAPDPQPQGYNNWVDGLEPPAVLDPEDAELEDDAPPPVEIAELAISEKAPTDGETDSRDVEVDIQLPAPVWTETVIGDDTWDRITVAGLQRSAPPGAPALPTTTYLIKVPHGTFTGHTVNSIDTVPDNGREIEPAAALALTDTPLNSLVDADTGEPPEASADPVIYGSNSVYPAETVLVGAPVDIDGRRFVPVTVTAYQWNPVTEAGLSLQRVRLTLHFSDISEDNVLVSTAPELAEQWRLAGRADAVKLLVSGNGLYRVTGSALAAAGFQTGGPVANVRCFRKGNEIAIDIEDDGGDGYFDTADRILFYGVNDADEYRTSSAYWCLADTAPGLRAAGVNANPLLADPAEPDAWFLSDNYYEYDKVYYETLNAPGADHWFEKAITANGGATGAQNNFPVTAANLNSSGPTSALSYQLRGQSVSPTVTVNHHVKIYVNSFEVDDIRFSGQELVTRRVTFPSSYLAEGANTVGFKVIGDLIPSGQTATSWVNWYELIYPRWYHAGSGKLEFNTPNPGRYTLSAAGSGPHYLYDIADPSKPERLNNANLWISDLSFAVTEGAEKRVLYYANEASLLTPTVVGNVPSTWNSTRTRAEYLAIGPDDLLDAAAPLVAYRKANGLWAVSASVQDVMDEFNWGDSNPLGIQKMLRHAWHSYALRPKYVLLVGDATQDARGKLASPARTGIQKVPAYLYDTPYFRAPSDSYLALLEGFDIVPDIAMGRLPAITAEQTAGMVAKILAYEEAPMSSPAAGRVTLVADNGTNHAEDALIRSETESLIAPIAEQAGKAVTRLYLEDGTSPPNRSEITQGIVSALNDGALLLFYHGHGSSLLWGDEQIFRIPNPFLAVGPSNRDDLSLVNAGSPFTTVTTFGCLDGNYVNPYIDSLAEEVLRKPQSGVVAYLGGSGLSSPPTHTAASKAFYEAIFGEGVVRIGDAMRAAILAAAPLADSESFLLTWTLFGDPATRLRVNHAPVTSIRVPARASASNPVILDGRNSDDPNGDSLSFAWTVAEKPYGAPDPELRGENSAQAVFKASGPGRYRLRLTATDSWGASSTADAALDVTSLSADSDLDGIPDIREIQIGTSPQRTDSDGDGIPDALEIGDLSQPLDADRDGFIDALDTDSDNDGLSDRLETAADLEGDGVPNYRDTDSDGDGKSDANEGTSDADGDGIPNWRDADDSDGPDGDRDSDGLQNAWEIEIGSNPGRPDTDLDGISDIIEAPAGTIPDTDSDSLPDILDDDSDDDGIPDVAEGYWDADGDGSPNFRDLDSDGDGIPDTIEGMGDDDSDGTPNFLDSDDSSPPPASRF